MSCLNNPPIAHASANPTSLLKSYVTTAVIICGFFTGVSPADLKAQDIFKSGIEFYDQRHGGVNSHQADPANINRAIDLFQKALEQDINPEETTTYLLRSYYFKGMFTGLSKAQQKEIYERGRELGEKMMKEFPDSVPIKFWYAANLGQWAGVHSFARAATSGISKTLRRICEDIIEDDPSYQGGGGYRILAQVHFYSPNIPLLMGWPSKEKALELTKKALEIDSDHPSNRILYAHILLNFDKNDEAEEQLHKLRDITPRTTHIIEDRYVQYRSQQLLEKHFSYRSSLKTKLTASLLNSSWVNRPFISPSATVISPL